MADNGGYIGRAPGDSSVIVARQIFNVAGVTTDFTFASGYTIGYLDAYLNGVKLIEGQDYDANDGSVVGLATYANDGDILELVGYKAFNAATIDTAPGNLTVGNKLTVTGISSFTDVVSSGIITADSFRGDGSNLTGISTAAVPGISTQGHSVFGTINVSGIATFGGNISVGGTITYDDVTNVDSVGIITAGKGFRATTGGIVVTAGVSTLSGGVNVNTGNVKVAAGIVTVGAGLTLSSDFVHLGDNKKIQLGIASDLTIQHNATNSVINNTTGQMRLAGDDLRLMNKDEDETYATFSNDGSVDLYYDNTKRIETISTGASVYGGLRLEGGGFTREHLNIVGTALNSNKVINLSDGMVHYRSAAVGAANVKLNIISNAGVNTDMAIGDIMSVTVITVAGNTGHFVDQIRIDGVEATAGVTTNWSGGSAPTDGGGSGIDSYAFNVMKTANATYVVLANQTKTS